MNGSYENDKCLGFLWLTRQQGDCAAQIVDFSGSQHQGQVRFGLKKIGNPIESVLEYHKENEPNLRMSYLLYSNV